MSTLTIEDPFVKKVVRCFGQKKLTEVELRRTYHRFYPLPKISPSSHNSSSIFTRNLSKENTSGNVSEVLQFLCSEGYCTCELSYVPNNTTENEVRLYFLTKKGHAVLSKKK